MSKKIRNIGLICIVVTIVLGATVVFSEPGSENDPLVSLSYLEKKIAELKVYVDNRLTSIGENGQGNLSNTMEVVEVKAGQSLIGKSGTEIILRGGKERTIAGELGGIPDITDGRDLAMGVAIPAEHLLIIPRDDGRGAYVVEDAIFMVRGGYEIR